MGKDISGFGLTVRIVADTTFPAGVSITQFADDTDPFDLPSMDIGETAMGLNGDQVNWAKAVPIKITLAVVPGGEDDRNLAILFEANRVGKGKNGARDTIIMTGIYGDGETVTLTGGKITTGMPGNSVASAGRFKSKAYTFSFENKVGTI